MRMGAGKRAADALNEKLRSCHKERSIYSTLPYLSTKQHEKTAMRDLKKRDVFTAPKWEN